MITNLHCGMNINSMLSISCLLVVSFQRGETSYVAIPNLPQAVFEGRNLFIIPLSLVAAKGEVPRAHPPPSLP